MSWPCVPEGTHSTECRGPWSPTASPLRNGLQFETPVRKCGKNLVMYADGAAVTPGIQHLGRSLARSSAIHQCRMTGANRIPMKLNNSLVELDGNVHHFALSIKQTYCTGLVSMKVVAAGLYTSLWDSGSHTRSMAQYQRRATKNDLSRCIYINRATHR